MIIYICDQNALLSDLLGTIRDAPPLERDADSTEIGTIFM